jgi:outer membrane protein assembly factor BamB
MVLAAQRPQGRLLCLLGSAVCFLIFLILAGLVYFRDPAYSDPARLQELLHAHFTDKKANTTDWPQWRGPKRDGVSAETNLLAAWPDDLLTRRKVWEQPVGEGYSSLAVAAGRAYTLMQDGDQEAVVCWDAETGKELWRYRYPARFIDRQGNGPRSTPAVDGDYVYTVGATGLMHCLKTHPSSAGGQVVWSKDLLQDFHASNLPWGVSFSPLVEGGLVYVNPGGPSGQSVAALDKYTGKTVWQALDDQAGYSSPLTATLAGKRQVIFFTAHELAGLSATDGTVYWRYPWRTEYDVNAATPIVAGDYVFVTSGYGHGCGLLKIEAAGDRCEAVPVYLDGRRNARLRSQFSSPVRYQDHIYGFDETKLTCLDFRTGKVCWRQAGYDKGSLLAADGKLIVLGEFGRLALVEANPAGFHELSAVQFSEQKCWTAPALAAGRLYLREPGRVVCLDLRAQR